MTRRRIGIYGGTFDPVHNGHLDVARSVVSDFGLECLLIVPAFVPPHKQAGEVTNSYHRYAMTVLATMDEPAMRVSNLELAAPNRPYTFETIASLREYYGDEAALFFVMGADSFQDLATWREPQRVLEGAHIIVVTRPGHDIVPASLPGVFGTKIRDLRGRRDEIRNDEIRNDETGIDETKGWIYLTDSVCADVSSTEIRRRVGHGESIEGLVGRAVADYIRKYRLYAQGN